MFTLYALEAAEPLTKRLYLDDSGNTCKGNYPPVKNFTSHEYSITNLSDFYNAVADAADKGWCLIKGELQRQLDNESRAGSTLSEGTTNWLVLDLDGLSGFTSIADFMDSHPELNDISYIVQYSSSSGIPNNKGLHAHVFILLSHPYHASYLKGWLIRQNVDGTLFGGKLVQQLTLNRTNSTLHYPIDITACQNDKLLYIAPPIIEKGVKYKMPKDGFIQLIKKQKNHLPIERLENNNLERWKTEAKKRFNEKRKEMNLPTVTGRTKMMDGFEVEPECGEFTITGMREERGFRYFNMNGGDSWSWYHPLNSHKYIHCFKDDRTYLTSRILPKYWARMEEERKARQQAPRDDGRILLAFRDLRSAAYFNGTWTPETRQLSLFQARSELQLDHFLQQHGAPDGVGDFIPQWTMEFNPQSTTICDPEAMYINTYVPSPFFYMERGPARDLSGCPTIERIILSAVSADVWNEVTEHFLNWVAVVFQHKVKTRTAWILHGTQGTGKGLIANNILTPLLGSRYVQQRRMSELEEKYTGWLEEALIAVIDEVQISASVRKSLITGDMKNWITEPRVTIRHMNRIAYLADSYVNFLLFSNMEDPVILDDTDRRYNTGDYQASKLNFTTADKKAIIDELPYFMDYIMQREADVDRAGEVIKTKSRANIITANKSSVDMLAEALIDGDLSPFIEAMVDSSIEADIVGAGSTLGVRYNKIVEREMNKMSALTCADKDGYYRVQSRLSRDELIAMFKHAIGDNISRSPSKFTRMLKHKRIELKKMRIDDKPQMGIEVEWVASKEWIEANKMPDKTNITPLRRAK